ncbi:MAG TPA: fibrinogen-like YCDxxxxGGGW domain-containing protein, partial [Kofleriaceae bacterium]|nr:fibrinogen-like YCDxxxxGGGW domain-containing protein [Kofleriaceae bacterium]
MTRLLGSSLLLVAACGFHPTASQATGDGATQATQDAPVIVAVDAAVAIDAKHFDDAPAVQQVMPKNCADALAAGMTNDGTVMIDPDGMGGAPPYQVYCDQTTANGGWTLVWVYAFTNYGNFQDGGNAVTPQPTWGGPTGANTTPTSTTTPTSRTSTGALDFTKWASL